MATKVKGSPPTTKEKRGSSPSSSQSPLKNTIQRGIKSPITSKSKTQSSPSPSPAKRTNSTSPSYARNVPKSGPESSIKTQLKPVMSRRTSLDKPLPPKSRVSVINKSQLPSSPSSARANVSSSSSKPLMGRLAKTRSFTAEKEIRSLRHDVKKFENLEAKSLSPKETINEIVEINNNSNNNAIDDTHSVEIEEMEEKVEDLDASTIFNVNNEDPDDIKSEVIVLEDNNIEPEIEVEEAKIDESSVTITPPNEKIESFDSFPDEEHESSISEMEEQSIIPNQKDANEEEEVEDEKTEILPPPPENQELKEKEDKAEVISHELEIKETEAVKEDNKNKNGGENGEVKKKVEVVKGKREISVVSNDAIEETATKLREQRVNRVRALAGAFETVISNQ